MVKFVIVATLKDVSSIHLQIKKSILLERLDKFNLNKLKNISNIGITASASAPEKLVQNLIKIGQKITQD